MLLARMPLAPLPLVSSLLLSLLLTLSLCPSLAAAGSLFDARLIRTLDAAAFRQAVKQPNAAHLVTFCSPRLPACREFASQLSGLARATKPDYLTFATLDCKDAPDVCAEQAVGEKAQPLVRLFAGGKSFTYKSPELKQKELGEWVWSAYPNHVAQMTAREEKKTGVLRSEKEARKGGGRDKSIARVILFTDKRATGPLWKSLALAFKGERVQFAEVRKSEKKLFDHYGIGKALPVIMIEPPVKDGEEEKSARRYEGKLEQDALAQWVAGWIGSKVGTGAAAADAAAGTSDGAASSSVPSIPELADQSCLDRYCSGPLCLVLFLSRDHADLPTHLATFAAIEAQARASKSVGRVQFVWADSVVSPESAAWMQANFDLQAQDYPQLVLLAARKQRFAPYVGALSPAGVLDFLSGVRSGSVRTVPLATRDGKLAQLPPGDRCPKQQEQEAQQATEKPSQPTARAPVKEEGTLFDLDSSSHAKEVLRSPRPWALLLHAGGGQAYAERYPNLTADFARVAANMKDMVLHGSIDVTASPDLASFYGVSPADAPVLLSLPHRREEKTREHVQRYEGDLAQATAKDLKAFAQRRLDAAQVLVVTGASMQQFMGDLQPNTPFPPKLILFAKPAADGTVVVPDMLRALALEFGSASSGGGQGDFTFGVASSRERDLAKQFNVNKIPAVYVLGQQEDQPGQPKEMEGQIRVAASAYGGNIVYSELQQFCEQVQRAYQQQKLHWIARAAKQTGTPKKSAGASSSSGSSTKGGKKPAATKKRAEEDDDHVDLDATAHDEL